MNITGMTLFLFDNPAGDCLRRHARGPPFAALATRPCDSSLTLPRDELPAIPGTNTRIVLDRDERAAAQGADVERVVMAVRDPSATNLRRTTIAPRAGEACPVFMGRG